MSSDNPPYPYYNGIPFNPSFFTSDAGGLSVATANNLYLRKTVADTATAQETFSLGIKAQKVDGLLSSSIMYVGNNITSGSLILGNTGIRTKNQGILEAYSIRTPATNGQLTICTDLIAGGSVEIGSVDGTVNLLGSAAGGVNVPTSAGVSTNAVNVTYLTTALSNVPRLNQVQTFTELNTFNKPFTIGYAPSTNSIASLSFISGTYTQESRFIFNIGTVFTAYAPLNNIPTGRYILSIYVFINAQASLIPIELIFATSASSISNGQTTGLTPKFAGNELYAETALNQKSLNASFIFDVPASPNNNVAMLAKSTSTLGGTQVFQLQATRIG